VTFQAGVTNVTIEVPVLGDLLPESNEVFYVNLSSMNAQLATNRVSVTIVNDDDLPYLTMTNGEILEGNTGHTNAVVFVYLSRPSSQPVTIEYYTASGGAAEDVDYQRRTGALIMPPGNTNQCIAVPVYGDILVEGDEVFYIVLKSASNATISAGTSTVTILDDDGRPGYLHHFTWGQIPATQLVNQPFGVTITARDYFGNLVSNFNESVSVQATGNHNFPGANLLGSLTHVSSLAGNLTVGYTFTPHTNILITHLRHYAGTRISIWDDSGQLLLAQDVQGASTVQWSEIQLAQPLRLMAGQKYRIGAFSGGTRIYWHTLTALSTRPVEINQNFMSAGDHLPASPVNYQALVDFCYQIMGPDTPILVSPTSAGPFMNGTWSGQLAVQEPVNIMQLNAIGREGHSGKSNPFEVVGQAPIIGLSVQLLGNSGQNLAAGARLLKITCRARKPFVLEASSDLKTWTPVYSSPEPQSGYEHTEPTDQRRFFRARTLP
jgi:hypothetical protein